MKNSMRRLAPVFSTNRMVREYADELYVPAFDRGEGLSAEGLKRAVELARQKEILRHRWGGIRIVGVHASGNGHYKVGQDMQVEALVDLPELKPDDVQVQLYAGPLNASGSFENAQPMSMSHVREMGPARHLFTGTVQCASSGRHGYAIRVVPGGRDLATPFEPGLILWN
jgi:starch phosphorylase